MYVHKNKQEKVHRAAAVQTESRRKNHVSTQCIMSNQQYQIDDNRNKTKVCQLVTANDLPLHKTVQPVLQCQRNGKKMTEAETQKAHYIAEVIDTLQKTLMTKDYKKFFEFIFQIKDTLPEGLIINMTIKSADNYLENMFYPSENGGTIRIISPFEIAFDKKLSSKEEEKVYDASLGAIEEFMHCYQHITNTYLSNDTHAFISEGEIGTSTNFDEVDVYAAMLERGLQPERLIDNHKERGRFDAWKKGEKYIEKQISEEEQRQLDEMFKDFDYVNPDLQ